jgi:hypothetical protein
VLDRAEYIGILPFRTENKYSGATPNHRVLYQLKRSYCLRKLTGVPLMKLSSDVGRRQGPARA